MLMMYISLEELFEETLKIKAKVYLTLIHGDYNCDRKINFEYLHTSLQCVENDTFKTIDRNGIIPVDISVTILGL